MKGFYPRRFANVLRLPPEHEPILVVHLGYTATPDLRKTRLPLDHLLHYDRWPAYVLTRGP